MCVVRGSPSISGSHVLFGIETFVPVGVWMVGTFEVSVASAEFVGIASFVFVVSRSSLGRPRASRKGAGKVAEHGKPAGPRQCVG